MVPSGAERAARGGRHPRPRRGGGDRRLPQRLAAQTRPRAWFETLLVLDRCRERPPTRAGGRRAAGPRAPRRRASAAGAGAARGHGMGSRRAAARRRPARRPDRLDRRRLEARPSWLESQLALVAAGARAIGGLIELAPDDRPRPAARGPCAPRRATRRAARARQGRGPRRRAPPLRRRLACGHRRDLPAGRRPGAAPRAGGRGVRRQAEGGTGSRSSARGRCA